MKEEEEEDIELDIEAKYVNKTEKEFLSNITYAECIYILTPENKYCDKIRELSVLKLCEIIDRLQKEKKELELYNNSITSQLEQMTTEKFKNGWFHQSEFKDSIPVQKVKDKIEEVQKEYNKLDKQVDEYINDANKDLSKYYENKEKIGTMQTLAWVIDNLQELLEGRK